MIDRRTYGTISLHLILIAIESVGLWWILSICGIRFSTLLPYSSHPIAIVAGVILSSRYTRFFGARLLSLGILESTRLSLRQTGSICVALFALVVTFKDPGISRVFLAFYFSILFLMLILINRLQPAWIARLLFAQKSKIPTILVGSSRRFPDFASWLHRQRALGVEPIGMLTYKGECAEATGLKQLGTLDDLATALAATHARKVIMLDHPESSQDAEKLVNTCVIAGCRLLIHNNFGYRLTYPLTTLQAETYSFFTLNDEPLEDPFNRCLKRALDVALATMVVGIILPPLSILVWFMQRLQSRGPVFYRQHRSGYHRHTFEILKFRTMHTESADPFEKQAQAGDARVYAFGRFLRKTSLDELPQFINVLRGEMSIVGPRPHMIAHDETFSHDVQIYMMRFFAKPGITGLAQCSGYRGETDSPDKLNGRIRNDLVYIREWSIWMDIKIILATARQVLFPPKSAY